MRKSEREKLRKKTRELLSGLGITVDEWSDGSLHTIILAGSNGEIDVTFYNARTAKDTPWLACQLRDWPAALPNGRQWNGFAHWKQNVFAFDVDTAEEVVRLFSQHLRQLGVSHEALIA